MPTVLSGSVPIHYEVIGEGTPVLLVHGFMSSFEGNWGQSGWIDFLITHGRQVVGVDLRGHGQSGKPHDPAAYVDPHLPGDVLAVMDAVRLERVDLMGYSMGGAIAIRLLARHPDRCNSVIAGGAGLRLSSSDQHRSEVIAAGLEAHDVSAISDPAARFNREFAESRAHDPHSLADADPDLNAFAAIMRRPGGTQTPEDVVTRVRQAQLPLLAVVGDKDPALPEAKLLTETVPNAQLVTVPGGDHLSTVSAAAYKDAVAIFLGMPTLASP
jgi:pimeloyl-ACP methyl ester carboxylesterase